MIRAFAALVLVVALGAQGRTAYPFASRPSLGGSVVSRIAPPRGFTRVSAPEGSFAQWLRGLPLEPGRPHVRLFDGRLKANQSAQHAVIDIDTGARDLQQCADAVMRLRAEYLRASGRASEIAFRFTSGDLARWTDWSAGMRPIVSGSFVRWQRTAAADDSYPSFRRYLNTVFTYAGSHSLEKELRPIEANERLEPGDVFIQGGFPGHAVIVIDVARNAAGETVLLSAQSYMPAQDMHILVNPTDATLSPWYRDVRTAPLSTPEWTFPPASVRRFK
jgi:Domain of unknown function (4846)